MATLVWSLTANIYNYLVNYLDWFKDSQANGFFPQVTSNRIRFSSKDRINSILECESAASQPIQYIVYIECKL